MNQTYDIGSEVFVILPGEEGVHRAIIHTRATNLDGHIYDVDTKIGHYLIRTQDILAVVPKSFEEYQAEVLRTASMGKGKELELCISSLGLCGEAGEFADHIKKFVGHGHPLDREKALKELGDVLWYVARLTEMLGSTLKDVAAANSHKLRTRYPGGFSSEASVNRKEG